LFCLQCRCFEILSVWEKILKKIRFFFDLWFAMQTSLRYIVNVVKVSVVNVSMVNVSVARRMSDCLRMKISKAKTEKKGLYYE
jgi:hypothetical protein